MQFTAPRFGKDDWELVERRKKIMKIGIIGTGMLGEAVGLHLLDVGYDVTVFNRTEEQNREA